MPLVIQSLLLVFIWGLVCWTIGTFLSKIKDN